MKSKYFDIRQSLADKYKSNKSYDFVNLYKPTSENYDYIGKDSSLAGKSGASITSKSDRSPNKKKKSKQEPVEVSQITIDGPNLAGGAGSSPADTPRVTSTPKPTLKKSPKVKSIMKSSPSGPADDTDEAEGASFTAFTPKSKKRNKSVSFMLDDTDEIAVKKTKSDESVHDKKINKKAKSDKEPKKLKKGKKSLQAEKENKDVFNMEIDIGNKHKQEAADKKTKSKIYKRKSSIGDVTADPEIQTGQEKKKKLKKRKKGKQDDNLQPAESEIISQEDNLSVSKPKKSKKKKNLKVDCTTDASENEGEPATKTRKKDAKPDKIAEDLENLSIGDNPHTLSSLLDEMTVVDKDEKKKNKHRRKKATNTSNVSSDTIDLEKIEEGKEKVKWKKRKWNKDKKGSVEDLATSVIIDKLPLNVILTYKKLLTEHFEKVGLIKKIGIAEVYPAEQQVPVFTTTVTFYSDGAATKALEEDNTIFEGSRIRVKRPLPPTETTIVVRSYAELTDQNISSAFSEAGKIRNIRQLVKGKKSMATAFVEFDGVEAVERALKLAADAKIGGKKIHVSKFELRGGKQKQKGKSTAESENEGDSENSD